jgi:uncharacterized RmlC-like cupin family protein
MTSARTKSSAALHLARTGADGRAPAADAAQEAHCITVTPARLAESKQGHQVFEGISAESAGARGLCLHVVSFPAGGRARAHLHRDHESAVYMLEGEVVAWYGADLEHSFRLRQGEMAYIPAGVAHLPVNASPDRPAVCVVARTDPNEQESVELLPELDRLPHVGAWPIAA